jgi:hypothetical protein
MFGTNLFALELSVWVNGSVAIYNGSTWVYSGSILPLDVWSHVSIISTGSSFLVYVNNVSSSLFGSGKAFAQTAQIGGTYDIRNPSDYWDGRIDDMRIFDSVLDSSDLAALYAAGRGGQA